MIISFNINKIGDMFYVKLEFGTTFNIWSSFMCPEAQKAHKPKKFLR